MKKARVSRQRITHSQMYMWLVGTAVLSLGILFGLLSLNQSRSLNSSASSGSKSTLLSYAKKLTALRPASIKQDCDPSWYCLGECASDTVRTTFGGNHALWRTQKAANENKPGACDLPASQNNQQSPQTVNQNYIPLVANPSPATGTTPVARVLRHFEGETNTYSYLPRGTIPPSGGGWAVELRSHAHELMSVTVVLKNSQYTNRAKETLLRHIRLQSTDGGYPYVVFPDSQVANDTDRTGGSGATLPVLAYEAWKLYQTSRDRAFLTEVYNSSKRNMDWWDAKRREGSFYHWRNHWESVRDKEDLPTWARTGGAENQFALDLQCYLYKNLTTIAAMARELGDTAGNTDYTNRAASLASAIQSKMWSADRGVFFGIDKSGNKIDVYDVSVLLPLWAGFATTDQARTIAALVNDPAKFKAEYGIPVLSKDNPKYQPEHWYGASWPVMNYFVAEGLRNYGYAAESNRIISASKTAYAAHGPSEYYHPDTGEPRGYRDYIWGNIMGVMGN